MCAGRRDVMPTGRNQKLPKKPPPGQPSINKFLVRSKNSEETEGMATLGSKEKENEVVDTATLVAFFDVCLSLPFSLSLSPLPPLPNRGPSLHII